ncbi:penicillin-binding protein 2 [Asticcacaulis solisilvae]|uniref:penicillin-binding protein 2 n=1 Tax=Asticcacaulis solisilvae TaxID=1217274 RepID=UPI003FD77AFF
MPEPSIVFTDVNERQGAFHRRTFIMGGVVAFGLFALTGRLASLQIVQGSKYQKLSAANQFNFRLIAPPRGNILDRNGKLIAGNRPSFRVMIEANEVKNIDETLDQLSYILPQTLTARRRILRDINQNRRSVPTIVAQDLSWDDFSRVSLYANDIPGVVADMDWVRAYYYGGAFSHVVGYVSKISDKDMTRELEAPDADSDLLHHPSFRIGKQGIEKAYDKDLRGTKGGRKVEVDSRGQVVREDPAGSISPQSGKEIVLTLDADIQQRAIDVFGTESGAAVMMNIHTGEVLCMTSSPGFDPNLFVSGIPSDTYKLLHDYERNPLFDKALTATFPPGSTFKTMVALAALENGYDPNITHTCNGAFPFGNHVFKCDQHHGTINLHQAIVTSCDVYFYQCALSMGGPDPVAKVATKFGLGQLFDIGIDGQKAGLVPTLDWKKKYFEKRNPANMRWWPGETPSFGIGQGFTNVNALQNCVMVSRLANGKKAVNPILVKSIDGVDQVSKVVPEDLPFNEQHIAFVHAAMADVVNSGTARGAADLGLGPVKMAGKTGTAQSVGAGGGRTAHGAVGQWDRRDHAWFVAFAPADDPKYAMAVIVQHGGFGAAAAAPKAREIMRTALLKDPDIQKRIVGVNIEDKPPPMDDATSTDPDTAAGDATTPAAPPTT